MNIKFMILLCIEAIVGYGDDTVVTHCLDDVFQIVSARRHIFQEYTILEFATVANHGIEEKALSIQLLALPSSKQSPYSM